MPSYPIVPVGSRFTTALQAFAHDPQASFQSLPQEQLQRLAQQEQLDFAADPDCVWTPGITLWAFLTQALSGSKSCVAAVARVLVLLVALGRTPCSANTGAYCKARAKLAVPFLRRLTEEVGAAVEDLAPPSWQWHCKRVLLVDGLEVTAPDTPDNQQVYPQPGSQKPGLGFPMIRVVVLLAFATACLIGAEFGPHHGKETGETALFRQLLDHLRAGDVTVADRYYCSFWMIALVLARSADVVFRLHQRRRYDFSKGQRLGPDDHLVVWTKPAQRPDWMDEPTYAAFPETIKIRELRFRVQRRGYRSQEIVVATTLLDAQVYAKSDLEDLYGQRWHAELDIRSIKQTMGMDQLSCKTPEMVQRELWVHLLGYNLVRKALAEAAWEQGLCPRQLSFAAGLQILEAFRWLLLCGPAEARAVLRTAVLLALATHRVGNRPGRCEPRCVKRRPKQYPRLMKPRAQARAELLGAQP
jgi:Transposase DDE domain